VCPWIVYLTIIFPYVFQKLRIKILDELFTGTVSLINGHSIQRHRDPNKGIVLPAVPELGPQSVKLLEKCPLRGSITGLKPVNKKLFS
jgi:hypothetical protein